MTCDRCKGTGSLPNKFVGKARMRDGTEVLYTIPRTVKEVADAMERFALSEDAVQFEWRVAE